MRTPFVTEVKPEKVRLKFLQIRPARQRTTDAAFHPTGLKHLPAATCQRAESIGSHQERH